MRDIQRFLVFSLLITLLLSACQGLRVAEAPSSTPAPTDTPAPTSTPEPTATPTSTSTPTTTPTPTNTPTPTPIVLSEEDLAEIMLTLNDLSPGFTVDEVNTGPITRETLAERGAEITLGYLEEAGDWTSYQAAYERTGFTDYGVVISWAIAFESEAQATDFVDNYLMFFSSVDFVPVSFEKLGEQHATYKATSENEGYSYDIYNIVFRRQNVVNTLRYVSLSGFENTNEITNYANLLDERLEEAVSGE